MIEWRKKLGLSVTRTRLVSLGSLIFGLLFHFFVAAPQAAARHKAPRGLARLTQVLSRPSTAMAWPDDKPASKAPKSLVGDFSNEFPQSTHKVDPANAAIADPALLHLLQAALKEGRDAEYISRLRSFRRYKVPIHCKPLPSYSLKGLDLSEGERDIALCHERKQLQALCIIPSSIFEPMHCPKGYLWDWDEENQEQERKWLAARTARR